MDSIDQNMVGFSGRFRIIRIKKLSFCKTIVFASSVGRKLTPEPTLKMITKSLETFKLSGKVNV